MKRFLFRLIILLSFLSVITPHILNHASASDIPSQILNLPVEGSPSMVSFEKGKMLYNIMAWADAVTAFSGMDGSSIQEIPQEIIDESNYLMANSLLKTGKFPEAKNSIEKVQSKSKFYYKALYTKALISINTDKYNEAAESLEQIIKNIPDSKTAKLTENPEVKDLGERTHLLLGFIYMNQANHSEAGRHFALIPEDSPLYSQALYGSGWAYANMGRWVRTVIFWEELAVASPDSPYAREVMPYIGHAYTTLSAYGKALEQNGNAIKFYEDLLKRVQVIENDIPNQDTGRLKHTVEITGNDDLIEKLNLYNGLVSMEETITDIKNIISSDTGPLISDSQTLRKEILDTIKEDAGKDIKALKLKLLEESAKTSLEMARNLHLEGGGRINNEMNFNLP
ncbi:MAG: tetratricopeptide repeat protein [Nitrospirae bacterium]|nr:tetratricopeptide repeat protein [Nitrospirota bacterium]